MNIVESQEKIVYLIRHAESARNLEPHIVNGRSNHIDITTEGERQAARLGAYLLRHNILPGSVYVSPALRTRRTADIVLKTMGLTLPYQLDERLQELDTGEFTGRVRTEVYNPAEEAKIKLQLKDYKSPAGESMHEVAARMLDALHSYAAGSDAAGPAFVFGHGLAIRCAVGEILGWSHAETRLDRTPNTSLTTLVHASEGWHAALGQTGQIPHLVG